MDSSPPNSPPYFFLRLLESTTQPFVAVDCDFRIILTNPAFEGMTGFTGDELRQKTIIELTPGPWRETGDRIVESLRNGGRSVRYEKEYFRKDGSAVPVEVVLDVDRDDDQEVRGFFAFVSDITERKAVASALTESEKRFRKLYDEAPSVITRLIPKGGSSVSTAANARCSAIHVRR